MSAGMGVRGVGVQRAVERESTKGFLLWARLGWAAPPGALPLLQPPASPTRCQDVHHSAPQRQRRAGGVPHASLAQDGHLWVEWVGGWGQAVGIASSG